jgi:hypothetical protein
MTLLTSETFRNHDPNGHGFFDTNDSRMTFRSAG